jgi:hypothetical protein
MNKCEHCAMRSGASKLEAVGAWRERIGISGGMARANPGPAAWREQIGWSSGMARADLMQLRHGAGKSEGSGGND